MSEKKRVWEIFSFYDRAGLERRLERMAQKGWMLKRIGPYCWTYRRAEPQTLRFHVCWFPPGSSFDPEPTEAQQTYRDFCERTGWTLAAAWGQMQVFYNPDPDPIPIETDPAMEVENIHSAMARTSLPSQFLLLALSLLNGALFLSSLRRDPIRLLSSAAQCFTGLCWLLVFLLTATECLGYFLWRRRALAAAARGEFCEAKGHRGFQIFCLGLTALGLGYYFVSIFASGDRRMLVIALLMFLVYLPGLSLLAYAIRRFLQKRKVSAGLNRTLTFLLTLLGAVLLVGGITGGVMYGSAHGWFSETGESYVYRGHTFALSRDALPLQIEDLRETPSESYTREHTRQRSPLLEQYTARQFPRLDAEDYARLPWLSYTVTVVKVPALYAFCRESLWDGWEKERRRDGEADRAQPVDPAPWGAEAAYQLRNAELGAENRFLLCYPDRFVEIEFDAGWELTEAQMARVGEALGAPAPA